MPDRTPSSTPPTADDRARNRHAYRAMLDRLRAMLADLEGAAPG